jgi:hypothetical protein
MRQTRAVLVEVGETEATCTPGEIDPPPIAPIEEMGEITFVLELMHEMRQLEKKKKSFHADLIDVGMDEPNYRLYWTIRNSGKMVPEGNESLIKRQYTKPRVHSGSISTSKDMFNQTNHPKLIVHSDNFAGSKPALKI